jgi:hypothetical protein
VRDNDEVLETEVRWRHGRVSGAFIRTDMGLSLEKNDKRWGHVNMWRNLYKLRKMIETLYGSMFQDCLSHTLGKIPLLKHLGRSPGQGFDHETSLGLGLYLGVVLLTNRSARLLLGRTLRLWRRSYFHF